MSSIYLAARYGRREELAGYADELEALGHDVTSRWVRGGHESPRSIARFSARWAQEDLDDLARADVLVAFTEATLVEGTLRGGRHVEFGVALALSKRLILVGPRENVFHWLPRVESVETWDQAKAALEAGG